MLARILSGLLFAVFAVAPVPAFAAENPAAAAAARGTPVAAGEIAPDFTLEDQDGRKHALSAERGKRPVVLVFYRGYWCPNCARQFAELRTLLKPGEQTALWGISVDSRDGARRFIEKIAGDGRGSVAFPLLSDPQHKVIDAYGLQDPVYVKLKEEGIPWPTTVVIDKSGRIAWMRIDKDFRQRPKMGETRAALDALK